MAEAIKTQKVPLTRVRRPGVGPERKYPFETMKVGEMFFLAERERNTMVPHASATGKKLGKKFATRMCHCRLVKGVWTPCEPDEKGAVQGVGVWRTE